MNFWLKVTNRVKWSHLSSANRAPVHVTIYGTCNTPFRNYTGASVSRLTGIATSFWRFGWCLTALLSCVLGVACAPAPKRTIAAPVPTNVSIATLHPDAASVSVRFSIAVNPLLKAAFTTEQEYATTNGSVIRFAANDSKSSLGYPIVAYAWNFGDGSVCTTCVHIATAHFYKHGKYTVTLTVTDDHNNVAIISAEMTP